VREQRDARGSQRQAHEGASGAHAGKHRAQHLGRLLAALEHVDVRVGLITDDDVGRLGHAPGDVRVQVQRDDHRRVGTNRLAHAREQFAVGIVALRGGHGPVIGDVDRIDGRGRLEPRGDRLHGVGEEGVVNGAGRLGPRQHRGRRPPGTGRVHGGHEAAHLRGHDRVDLRRLGEDRLALEIVTRAKVGLRRDRREGVALEHHSQQGDAWRLHLDVHPFVTLLRRSGRRRRHPGKRAPRDA